MRYLQTVAADLFAVAPDNAWEHALIAPLIKDRFGRPYIPFAPESYGSITVDAQLISSESSDGWFEMGVTITPQFGVLPGRGDDLFGSLPPGAVWRQVRARLWVNPETGSTRIELTGADVHDLGPRIEGGFEDGSIMISLPGRGV
jgi:hypothetical protein